MGLLEFLKGLPTRNELTGAFGERLAQFYASTMAGVYILHDALIEGAQDHTSQIDLLIIGNRGIYLIEVKLYADAKIYGDTAKSKWYYYRGGKKFELYSPLKQNQKHVEYLQTFLKDFGEIPCFSVVTMLCDDFKVSGTYPSNTALCNSLHAMEKAVYRLAEHSDMEWDDEKKKAIYQFIKENQIAGKDARKEHKETVIAYKNTLEEQKTKKLCPYCKAELVLRKGKYGEFYGCPNYPKCKYTQK